MTEVKDSLYEQFCPLTTVAGQHFVEWFSGASLEKASYPNRWKEGGTGTETIAISDSVDGWLSLKTQGNNAGTTAYIDFGGNEFRPFAINGSVCIIVSKLVTTYLGQKPQQLLLYQ